MRPGRWWEEQVLQRPPQRRPSPGASHGLYEMGFQMFNAEFCQRRRCRRLSSMAPRSCRRLTRPKDLRVTEACGPILPCRPRWRTVLHRLRLRERRPRRDRAAIPFLLCYVKVYPSEQFPDPRHWCARRRGRPAQNADDGERGRLRSHRAVRRYCRWRYGPREFQPTEHKYQFFQINKPPRMLLLPCRHR